MRILKLGLAALLPMLCLHFHANAQYDFEVVHHVENTEVKSQGNTGTCWSFATISFLESEIIRKGGTSTNLSEMYIVRDVYKDKARNYILRQGKANFTEGALAHDMISAGLRQGLYPEEAYSGMKGEKHDHEMMFTELKLYLDTIIARRDIPANWEMEYEGIMDKYLTEVHPNFLVKEKEFDGKSFTSYLDLKLEDYLNVTSFSHHPFYQEFILEIPDNYSNGSYYNVPIDQLENMVDEALEAGHSVVWDGDVSEKGFAARQGLAINPQEMSEECFANPCKEKEVSQQDRQQSFESYVTTDDHLMHLVGITKDQNGDKYYLIKNSWGELSDYKGYLMMSRSYFRAKTVAVTLNKDFIKEIGSE